jgi:hypothetical protein
VSAENRDFGPATDPRVEGPHEHLSITSLRERFVAEDADARHLDPESSGLEHIPSLS